MSNPSVRRTVRDHGSQYEASEIAPATSPAHLPMDDTSDQNSDAVCDKLTTIKDILVHADQAAYQWNVSLDQIHWASDTRKVLKLPDEFSIKNHTDLLRHIGKKSAKERLEAIKIAIDAAKQPSSYTVAYKFFPDPWDHENYLWIEERGYSLDNQNDQSLITRGVLRVFTEHKNALDDLRYWANRDEITCQLNRPQLLREIETALTRSRQRKSTSIFLLAAVENLTFINETYGYAVGDEVLAVIGQRLSVSMRTVDCIGRHSANKFGILLQECGTEAMQHVSNRLLNIVRDAPIKVGSTSINVTLAIGGVIIPDQAEDVQETLSAAHEALDQARVGHQNKFSAFRPNPHKDEERQRFKEMADDIMAALNEDRMVLAMQPIVASNTNEPEFYECLIRMRRDNGELVSAQEIIPVVEKLGLTSYLDLCVLKMAVDILANDPNINLSINVSGQTTSDHDWLIAMQNLTRGRRDIRERLIVEITETSAIRDLDETVNFVDTLQDLGCRVAIDDFGSGYTTFQNLRFFGVDMLKIDGSFVANIKTDPHNLMFVETLLDLAKKFGIKTVVEWVIDEEVAELMREAGADYLQGSRFGMPVIANLPTTDFNDIGDNI